MSVSMTSSSNNINVQMKTKAALFSWIDNITKELSDYRNQENYATVKKVVKYENPSENNEDSHGFSEIYEGQSVSSIEKREISDRFSFDKEWKIFEVHVLSICW